MELTIGDIDLLMEALEMLDNKHPFIEGSRLYNQGQTFVEMGLPQIESKPLEDPLLRTIAQKGKLLSERIILMKAKLIHMKDEALVTELSEHGDRVERHDTT